MNFVECTEIQLKTNHTKEKKNKNKQQQKKTQPTPKQKPQATKILTVAVGYVTCSDFSSS